MKIILLRHGESEWNIANKFTGWTNVELTKNGENEAKVAANSILKNSIVINQIYCSLLKRAISTSFIVAKIIGYPKDKIVYNWRLNERHYGALQGKNKSEVAKEFGEDQVHIWRRSFDTPPPLIPDNDPRHPKFIKEFESYYKKVSPGESLKDVIVRLMPFWESFKKELIRNPKNILIVGHSNSLRAIIKMLENISDQAIMDVNIPTGTPLVYTLNKQFLIMNKKYLVSSKLLAEKQKIIIDQGKIK